MAVTPFQSRVLRWLAARRRTSGESYVAGGVALNLMLEEPRRSRDIDLFHDTEEALSASWAADRAELTANGCRVQTLREAPSFVEALVSNADGRTVMQWTRDSAFRFFPLVEDERMGLCLHAFDLATNKVLAMAGRLEPRDWVDVMACDEKLQPLGYLAWAACGKDPGYNPASLLAAAGRHHYSQAELDALDFEGDRPSAGILGRRWHDALNRAAGISAQLPADRLGQCVLAPGGGLFKGDAVACAAALALGSLVFHEGSIGGAWPRIVE